MPNRVHKYREYLYENEEHPEDDAFDLHDRRDSFTTVYLSLIPFLAMEYFLELRVHSYAAGLVFPTGFLLFWAYYYTFYRPNALEDRLKIPTELDLLLIPSLILGCAIWFIKVTVIEIFEMILPKKRPQAPSLIRKTNYRKPPPKSEYLALPSDVQEALRDLGLLGCRNWEQIHHRYRELAKRYHPDLNREITDVGKRFMRIDAAYHRLVPVKDIYFKNEKKSA